MNWTDAAWWWGVALDGIVGAVLAVLGVAATLAYDRKRRREDRKHERELRRAERWEQQQEEVRAAIATVRSAAVSWGMTDAGTQQSTDASGHLMNAIFAAEAIAPRVSVGLVRDLDLISDALIVNARDEHAAQRPAFAGQVAAHLGAFLVDGKGFEAGRRFRFDPNVKAEPPPTEDPGDPEDPRP